MNVDNVFEVFFKKMFIFGYFFCGTQEGSHVIFFSTHTYVFKPLFRVPLAPEKGIRYKRTEGLSYFCTVNVRFEQYMWVQD